MKSGLSTHPALTLILLMLLLTMDLVPTVVLAEGSEAAVISSENIKAQDSPDDTPDNTQVSDTERLNRLKQTIKLDEEKLAEDRKQLADLDKSFEDLNERVAKSDAELVNMKQQLIDLGGAEASDEAVLLNTEIQSLEQLIAVAKNELENRFKARQALKEQIASLEEKITTERQALELILNPPAPQTKVPQTPPSIKPAIEQRSMAIPSPTQVLGPGTETIPEKIDQQPVTAKPETAEQIEARQEVEELEAKAQLAEQDLSRFVERKRALDQQIKLEETLLNTAKESQKNLEAALDVALTNLQKLSAVGADKAKLKEAERIINEIRQLQDQKQAEINQRFAFLETLNQRREALNEEQKAITEQTEKKREEAESARKRSVWLASPLHPSNIGQWLVERGPRILLVILVAWGVLILVRISARRVARLLVKNIGGSRRRGTNRADTLALSFQSALDLIIVVVAILLAFQEAGVDIKTVMGGAAILGVAFAFGAQNLMRDFFTGFMIIFEDQYELGDLVTIGTITGTVEKVNMRTTVLRDLEGRVHFIPNGEIKSVTNRTYVWGRALMEIPVGFKEDVDRVIAIIKEVEEEFCADPEFSGWVTGEPVVLGVDRFSDYGVIIKTFMETRPDRIFETRREMLRRIKKRFDKEGIEISVPYRRIIPPGNTSTTTD